MTSGKSVVVLGSANMDLVATTATLPAAGETVLGNGFGTVPGGKGANQAVAAARAGAAVRFVGAVGRDAFADGITERLTRAGVQVDLLRRVDGSSGIAVITVDDDAENTIVVIAGANAAVTELTDDDLGAIAAAGILVLQLEIPIETVTAAATAAAAAGVTVLLNPSPARPLPAALLSAVSVLVVNEGEAAALGAAALATVPHVVTTLGAAGAGHRAPDGSSISVPAPAVAAVDTTGAGDAFTGVLAVAWAGGADPLTALRRACAAGALAATVAGAGDSAPDAAAIDALVVLTYG